MASYETRKIRIFKMLNRGCTPEQVAGIVHSTVECIKRLIPEYNKWKVGNNT